METSDGVLQGLNSYSTLGLSNFGLASPISQKIIHHELFVSLANLDGPRNVPAVIQQLAEKTIDANCALIRGRVISGETGHVISGTPFTAFYVAAPVYWPDEFSVCEVGEMSVAFAWLVPITNRESEFVSRFGWSAFEDRLIEAELDMCDINRKELPEV